MFRCTWGAMRRGKGCNPSPGRDERRRRTGPATYRVCLGRVARVPVGFGWKAASWNVVSVTPDQVHDMMRGLLLERDEMNTALATWRDLDSGEGAEALSTEIRGRVEHVRGMMRNAAHLIECIDEVVKLYPANIEPAIDAQREVVLTDRRELLAMWSELAGIAEKLSESLMRISGPRTAS